MPPPAPPSLLWYSSSSRANKKSDREFSRRELAALPFFPYNTFHNLCRALSFLRFFILFFIKNSWNLNSCHMSRENLKYLNNFSVEVNYFYEMIKSFHFLLKKRRVQLLKATRKSLKWVQIQLWNSFAGEWITYAGMKFLQAVLAMAYCRYIRSRRVRTYLM